MNFFSLKGLKMKQVQRAIERIREALIENNLHDFLDDLESISDALGNTGFCDKNGERIRIGDRLRFPHKVWYSEEEIEGIVIWEADLGKWMLEYKENRNFRFDLYLYAKKGYIFKKGMSETEQGVHVSETNPQCHS